MEKVKSILLLLIFAMGTLALSTSCGSDDNTDTPPIAGKWVNTSNTDYIFVFNADGTGYEQDKTGSRNFTYTYTESTRILKLYYVSSDLVLNYAVSLTGNTLMLTRNSTTWIFNRN